MISAERSRRGSSCSSRITERRRAPSIAFPSDPCRRHRASRRQPFATGPQNICDSVGIAKRDTRGSGGRLARLTIGSSQAWRVFALASRTCAALARYLAMPKQKNQAPATAAQLGAWRRNSTNSAASTASEGMNPQEHGESLAGLVGPDAPNPQRRGKRGHSMHSQPLQCHPLPSVLLRLTRCCAPPRKRSSIRSAGVLQTGAHAA